MNTEHTAVEIYAIKINDILQQFAKQQLTEHGLILAVTNLRNECLDAEKREHQRWFNKGFEFYHEQLTQRKGLA